MKKALVLCVLFLGGCYQAAPVQQPVVEHHHCPPPTTIIQPPVIMQPPVIVRPPVIVQPPPVIVAPPPPRPGVGISVGPNGSIGVEINPKPHHHP